MTPNHKRRIVVVCPTLFANDAVGNAAAQLFHGLSSHPENQVRMLVRSSSRTDVLTETVGSVTDLLFNDDFLEAELIVYIFAIYSDLFNALMLGNGRARQVARFHNVTPKAFVQAQNAPLIERSLRQMDTFEMLDEIWADSQENVETLLGHGVSADKIRSMPLGVRPIVRARMADKQTGLVRFLFVGRIVPSKGVDDLIEAAGLLRRRLSTPFTIDICGSTRHASSSFINGLVQQIETLGLADIVSLKGALSDEDLEQAYREAHVFVTGSHHEGFCVPVIEALAAGCVPVSYANSNLKYIQGGLGRLADHETPASLAFAMEEVAQAIVCSWNAPDALLPTGFQPLTIEAFDTAAAAYVAEFDPAVRANRIAERVALLTGRPYGSLDEARP